MTYVPNVSPCNQSAVPAEITPLFLFLVRCGQPRLRLSLLHPLEPYQMVKVGGLGINFAFRILIYFENHYPGLF